MAQKYTKTELLKIMRREINKEYIELDGFERRAKTYRAPSWAVTGDPCVVVETLYYGSTNSVKGRSEGYSTWDSSWEDSEVFLVDDSSDQLQDDLGNNLMESL